MSKGAGGVRGETERPAVGLEAELACFVDEEAVDPARLFHDPRTFLGSGAMHRTGTSYHLPTGGAVYFDTGVLELVTPVVELERGAPSQVVRSLWEGISVVRDGLDRWSERDGRATRLVGFSTHYNVSLPGLTDMARIREVAWVLVHLLPFPVMLLATNRRSTGVGVRPRPGRVEVTVDFTPDPALMAAAAALIIAAVQEVAGWARPDLEEAARNGYPLLRRMAPMPHTSRKGWLVRAECLDADPFQTSPDSARWDVGSSRKLTLRQVARRVARRLEKRLEAVAAPETLALISAVVEGRQSSLLDLEDRPAAYEHVGRLSQWRETDPDRPLPRSLYEQVMRDATNRVPLVVDGRRWVPVATRGWTRVLCRSDGGRRRIFTVDELVRLRRPR